MSPHSITSLIGALVASAVLAAPAAAAPGDIVFAHGATSTSVPSKAPSAGSPEAALAICPDLVA